MKTYNLDFLFAGLALLLIVFYHFKKKKKLDSASNRIFHFFMIIALADISLDIISSLLIMSRDPALVSLTKVTLTILYLLQLILPVALVYYAQTLRETSLKKIRKEMILWLIIPILIFFLIIINYRSGLLFSVDSYGNYCHGPLYMLMYYYALLYAGVLALLTIIHGNELSERNVSVLWEFLYIEAGCVIIQAVLGSYLMIGFGISVGVTVLYLTIGNPNTYMDHMTGALDKHYFDKWFFEQQAKGKPIHVITIDLPRLKHVNKLFGSSAGNQLLVYIAETLQKISPYVQVFRISGKKFFLVMQTLADYEQTRDKVLNLFRTNFDVNGRPVAFPAIICGIINGEKLPENTFISYVDYMTSLVKDSRETVLIQSDEKTMNGFIYEQKIELFLNEAIEKNLFDVYYQPIYSMETNRYTTLEALSRLWHPTLGYVPPDVFITLAERSGQILKIGLLQFRRICCFIKENEHIMKQIQNVKFNLSPVEILEYEHVQALIDIIREYELSFSYFQFEITETVATEYSSQLYEVLHLLQEVGISLCLDDFGSGYANLNTVLKLPFSCIKMDRSLLRGINEDPQVVFFYQSLISVLHEMKYRIVSEGVETKEEEEKLRKWGVDMIQGYYFSRPVNSQEILEILLKKEP
jgi:EAL domain-containing protein (putative c-di-GMP-specific phosphodiesterase class I)/GGDEF domain-containing protein